MDLAMPAISTQANDHEKVFSPLRQIVTVAEEAFAALQLENNLDRWLWLSVP